MGWLAPRARACRCVMRPQWIPAVDGRLQCDLTLSNPREHPWQAVCRLHSLCTVELQHGCCACCVQTLVVTALNHRSRRSQWTLLLLHARHQFLALHTMSYYVPTSFVMLRCLAPLVRLQMQLNQPRPTISSGWASLSCCCPTSVLEP